MTGASTARTEADAVTLPPALDGACALPHWGAIRAVGADAATFLHGQLTQDVAGLATGQARLAAYCSPKGRMLASFVVWRPQPDMVLLACHRSVLAATLKRLSMFVLRAKCRLTDATGTLSLTGLAGPSAVAALGGSDDVPGVWRRAVTEGASCIRLPDAAGVVRAWRIIDAGGMEAGGEASAGVDAAGIADATIPALPLAAWQWLDVQSGVATIEAATVDRFVPQMLNYEQIGGVDFRKGCYPGQEVVARSQYRGTAKRRAFLFEVDAAARPGDELFHSEDPSQPAGMVVNAAPWPMPGRAANSVLAEVKLQALDTGTLHLGSVGGASLHARSLPYLLLTS